MTQSNPKGGNAAEANTNGCDPFVIDLPADFGKASTNGHAAATADDDADMNGLHPGDEGYNPFNRRAANAKHAEDRQYGSPGKASMVGGLYAAEHGKRRLSEAGYTTVAALGGVSVADAQAAGLLDHSPSVADVARWYSHRGAKWQPPDKFTVDRAGLKAATKGIDPHRKIALVTIDALAAEGVPWAVKAAAKATADNLDASVKGAPCSFTLAELHTHHGVSADDAVGLAAMTPETRLASLRLLREWAAAENLRAQDTARSAEAARKAAGQLGPELFVPKNYVRDRSPHLIQGLFKAGEGSSAVLPARRKAGKSTANDEIAYALTTGEPFCGKLATHLPAGWQVVILDTEMSDEDIIDTYARCRPLLDDGRIKLWRLIGRAGLLDLRTERARRFWDDKIPEHSVILVDCLGPILAATGAKENSDDVALILDGLIALAVERRSALLVLHHMGKDDTLGARGHSSIEDKFGSIIHLTYKGDGLPTASMPRYIEATGRNGIGLERRKVTRNAAGHLVMDGDATATAAAESAEQRARDEGVFTMICLHPLLSVTRLAETYGARKHGWTAATIRKALEQLEAQGRAVNMGNGGLGMWVPQWLRDRQRDWKETMHTAETANSIAVEGSTAHEAAVRTCVEAICALVERDPSAASLPDTKMEKAVRKQGYPPRGVHILAYTRWKAACDDAGALITDPDKVLGLPTPEWSRSLGEHPVNASDWTDGE
ncbi:AAA family ATPase [Mycolicibacter kumamotonensis]|uniref:AAA family ATPase n=1 Tax=Mycolicibacter kumamotonensis TaxID=354243 RepID=A0A1B8SDI0_9MYCO|nr:AAA family ATPase [Mycolicibacter kumamotonensis]OBY30801.1 hypothetical protein ACT18_15835 [Mycolicibacter kumamotonensis]